MTPAEFRDLVLGALADAAGLRARARAPRRRSPGPERLAVAQPAEEALERSGVLIADYVQAGFRKIHLDCSMSCADDPRALTDAVIAARTARLCALAEAAWRSAGGEPPVYVIGTEVPGAGRRARDAAELAVTTPPPRVATVEAHRGGLRRRRGLRAPGSASSASSCSRASSSTTTRSSTTCPEKARALSACIDTASAPGLRGALDRLPDARLARGAGARSLRDPQGRARR